MSYPVRPIDPEDTDSLQTSSAFVKGADAAARQAAIEYVVKAHAFSQDDTKSIVYAATLDQPGRNVAGNVRIGPPAFDQDLAWLSGIVFHELVHSPQHAYYVSKGVMQIDPDRSETERRMIVLDEFEAYTWSLIRAGELDLSADQRTTIRHRATYALFDLDDDKARSLAKSHQFNAARDELIRQYKPPAAGKSTAGGTSTAMTRRGGLGCYA